MPAGYSGTPLPKKLGITETTQGLVINPPPDYMTLLEGAPAGAKFRQKISGQINFVHLFVTDRDELAAQLKTLRQKLHDEAMVWVSWPKKASKVETTVTEDVIRQLALPLGFVDVKVCAVSEVWSGLKLVVRKALRGDGASTKKGTGRK